MLGYPAPAVCKIIYYLLVFTKPSSVQMQHVMALVVWYEPPGLNLFHEQLKEGSELRPDWPLH